MNYMDGLTTYTATADINVLGRMVSAAGYQVTGRVATPLVLSRYLPRQTSKQLFKKFIPIQWTEV